MALTLYRTSSHLLRVMESVTENLLPLRKELADQTFPSAKLEAKKKTIANKTAMFQDVPIIIFTFFAIPSSLSPHTSPFLRQPYHLPYLVHRPVNFSSFLPRLHRFLSFTHIPFAC